ncbi:MAG: hypothetical protein IJQ73_00265, partial [Kiritimatiellae bacterium]|nr:hypothetical protein [Kiritimatiellia bacterium]
AVIAVCFTNAPTPFELAVDANGERRTVAVPTPDSPWRRIADVAFAPHGRSVFVKVESRGVPVKTLLLDGVETPFRTMRDGRTGRPFVLAAETYAALRPGARLLVDARFADGGRALASARVLRGPVLEARVTLFLPVFCDLHYGATIIGRVMLVSVDGGRATLPIPVTPNSTTVRALDYKVAEIIADG